MLKEKFFEKYLPRANKVFVFLLYLPRKKKYRGMSYKSVKYVIDLLKKNGFIFKSQKGSHMKFEKNGIVVVVPNHGSKGIEKGTFHNILKQAGIEDK